MDLCFSFASDNCVATEDNGDVVESISDSDNTIIKRFCFRAIFSLDPDRTGDNDNLLFWDNSFPAKFSEFQSRNGERDSGNQQLPISLASYLAMTSSATKGYLRKISLTDDDTEEIDIFEQILLSSAALPPKTFQFTLTINTGQIQMTGNHLKLSTTFFGQQCNQMEMWVDIPEEVGMKWRDEVDRMTSGLRVGLTVNLDESAVYASYFGGEEMLKLFQEKYNFWRRISGRWSQMLINEEWEDGGGDSDLAIQIGTNNKTIKLEKFFLETRPIFILILMEDNCDDIYEQMTEAGVQALIKFIFIKELGEAWKSCETTVELLRVGIAFGMDDLIDSINNLICFMPFNWLSLEMAKATQLLVAQLRRTDDDGGRSEDVEKKCLDFFEWNSADCYGGRYWSPGGHPTFWNETSSKVECCLMDKWPMNFKSGTNHWNPKLSNEFIYFCRSTFKTVKRRRNVYWANLLLGEVDNYVDYRGNLFANLKVCLIVGKQWNTGRLKIMMDEDEPSVNIFEPVAKFKFSPKSYTFNLVVSGVRDVKRILIDRKNLQVKKFKDRQLGLEVTGIDVWGLLNDLQDQDTVNKDEFRGKFTLTLVIDEEVGSALNLMEFLKNGSGFKKWTEQLLNGIPFPNDLVIWAKDSDRTGEGIKCNKLVLSERSTVLNLMLVKSNMLECRNNSIEIEDMTESCVKAMLEFLYGWNLGEALNDCGAALELLMAGDKYQMEDLVEVMVHLIWAMPFEWFKMDVAEDMVEFARRVGGKLKKIEEKCNAVLKRFDDDQIKAMGESESKV